MILAILYLSSSHATHQTSPALFIRTSSLFSYAIPVRLAPIRVLLDCHHYCRPENQTGPEDTHDAGRVAEDQLVEAEGEEHLRVGHVGCAGGLFVRQTGCHEELLGGSQLMLHDEL